MNERRHAHEVTLDSRARAALAAFRAEDDMPGAAQARVWERLEASAGPPERVRPIGHARKHRSLAGATAVVLAAAAALLLLASRSQVVDRLADAGRADAAGYASGGQHEAAAVPRQPEAPAEPVAAGAAEPPAAPASPPEHVLEDMAKEARRAEPRPRADTRGAEPAEAPGPSLAAEAELLARVQAAVQGERPSQALTLLAEYDRRFPAGTLREEHDALRAIALCAAGREREGRGAAQAFLRERGGSALADRVRGACQGA